VKIEIYSDVVCPWCYIGERRFRRALAAYPRRAEVEVVYRPYQLDPSMPERPIPTTGYLARKFGARADSAKAHVAAAARGEGIEIDFDRGRIVNTITAHRLMGLAERESGADVQREVATRLFAAHFESGGDVSDHGLLVEIGRSAGMDAERVREYLRSGEGLEEARSEIEEAVRIGVRAVPTFVFDGRYAVEGAQPTSTFLRVLEEMEANRGDEPMRADGPATGGDACADDSCIA
jgi:predicted DsbA family dithiol-disulfide isomerase